MELATVQSLLLLRLTVTLVKFGMQAENPKLNLVIRIVLLPGKRFSFFCFCKWSLRSFYKAISGRKPRPGISGMTDM